MNYRKLITVPIAMIMLFVAVPGFAADVNELERRLDIVSEELDRIKNSGGSGGGLASRTSVHGYGEIHWEAIEGDSMTVDHHRFVVGVHSEITNWIHLNAEIDFEHATSKLEFEFAHLDFLVSNELNFRAGTMLMPMGNLNEFHEPNKFYTTERPDFHSKIIPSTWQQAGAGVFGAKGDLSYRFYVTNAILSLNGGEADGQTREIKPDSFIRSGRSMIGAGAGKAIVVGDIALTGRVEKKTPGGQLGFSFYTGDSTADRIDAGGNVTLITADYKGKRGALDYDLGIAKGWVADTQEINAACGTEVGGTNGCAGNTPKEAFGFLATLAVHVPELMGMKTIHDWIPYIQYQNIRPEDEVGDGATGADKNNWEVLQIGFAYKPDPNVAFKAGYRINYYGGTEAAGSSPGDNGTSKTYFNFGMGYQY